MYGRAVVLEAVLLQLGRGPLGDGIPELGVLRGEGEGCSDDGWCSSGGGGGFVVVGVGGCVVVGCGGVCVALLGRRC